MSREYTEEEIQKEFLTNVKMLIHYWSMVPNKNKKEAMEGLAFSMLCMIDGYNASSPGFKLIPCPHPEDKDYHIANGENYYPEDVDIAGNLHEEFHK